VFLTGEKLVFKDKSGYTLTMRSISIHATTPELFTAAKQTASTLNYPFNTPAALILALTEDGWVLYASDAPKTRVTLDFTRKKMQRRLQSFGKSDLLVKAIGRDNKKPRTIVDATAGLGKEAFLLASRGHAVTLIERSPVLATLLNDAMVRAKAHPPLKKILSNMTLLNEDSLTYLKTITPKPDIIYLDPMFPERKKSALVKKDMQLLQRLLSHDDNANALLTVALQNATHRVVLKRPRHAPIIQPPDLQYLGKAHRFDVFFCHATRTKKP
jgi:16S rRNA (guanine1516-N2)-methyltransferase